MYVTEASAGVSPISTCQTIMSSGSYELTQNLNHDGTNPPNGCLEVDADNVTIDLKGFTITGSNTDVGIGSVGSQDGIVIRNGTIRGFTDGIDLDIENCQIEWMIVISNNDDGMALANDCIVSNNIVNDNNSTGLIVGVGSTLSNNIANNNGGIGMNITCPSNLVGNTAQGNLGSNLVQIGAGCKRYTTFSNTVPFLTLYGCL